MKQIYKLLINIAVGINLGLIAYSLVSGHLQLIALSIINLLLLVPAFLMIDEKEEA
tara:strand:- start:463 stop:630 length:168 start_codon:yes stop_codon:yes gene_type:complete